ncbi:SDR family oxidoreductase [Sphingobacterium olei]|uniref:SDR family oxidoreductase n=1 Tax=Sphingobacterium olei TaxID=2571155 RepID=A0A4U0NE29_9SPHI|nr:SDR family oxidoreductase [Sphingobacterium olei]TJZ51792.1 SDR family oxidoreductase [Sphingobacterium olei]
MSDNRKKLVLITGGSRGLGKDMALKTAKKGFDVIITYNSQQAEAEKVVADMKAGGNKAFALQLDVSQSKTFDLFVENLKILLETEFHSQYIDALINNAGFGIHADMSNTTEEQFDAMVNVHLKAPFFLVQKLFPLISNGGSIVNISSGLARFTTTGYDAYAVMKGGVETLTRYQAKFLGDKGIRVNTLAPGAIETDFGGGAVRDNKDVNAMIAGVTALGRVGLPDDIGHVAAFLVSNDSKWINGQRIEVAGGVHL